MRRKRGEKVGSGCAPESDNHIGRMEAELSFCENESSPRSICPPVFSRATQRPLELIRRRKGQECVDAVVIARGPQRRIGGTQIVAAAKIEKKLTRVIIPSVHARFMNAQPYPRIRGRISYRARGV